MGALARAGAAAWALALCMTILPLWGTAFADGADDESGSTQVTVISDAAPGPAAAAASALAKTADSLGMAAPAIAGACAAGAVGCAVAAVKLGRKGEAEGGGGDGGGD